MPLLETSDWDLFKKLDPLVKLTQVGNVLLLRIDDKLTIITITANVASLAAEVGVDAGLTLVTVLGDEYAITKGSDNFLYIFKAL